MFIEASPPPGVNLPAVTDFLREMLGIRAMHHTVRADLLRRIDAWSAADITRRMIGTRLKVLVGLALAEPWRFPTLLSDNELRAYYVSLSRPAQLGNAYSGVGSLGALGLSAVLSKIVSFVISSILYTAGHVGSYYSALTAQYREEMLRRGIDPDVARP
ncbi:hypothetical protein [Tistrella mobilis]|uniref:hypothetical protein n=1 Tax=Tistrella mobilis TaxID=171437 RepID=UPI00355697EF